MASLQTGNTSASAGATPQQEPPVIRPDASPADIQTLEAVHWQCLEKNGVPVTKSADGQYEKPGNALELGKTHGPAYAKCEPLLPESWLEREKRVNPGVRGPAA